MIIVDTNVLSEMLREQPNPAVENWLAIQDGSTLYISAVSEAELRTGVALMAPGRRREKMAEALEEILMDVFGSHVLSFDRGAAKAYAGIFSSRRTAGRPISQFDAQIAAIAHARGGAVATRNVKDFWGCGIEVINPWEHRIAT